MEIPVATAASITPSSSKSPSATDEGPSSVGYARNGASNRVDASGARPEAKRARPERQRTSVRIANPGDPFADGFIDSSQWPARPWRCTLHEDRDETSYARSNPAPWCCKTSYRGEGDLVDLLEQPNQVPARDAQLERGAAPVAAVPGE